MGAESNLFSEEENAYDDELVEQLTSFFEKKYLKKARKSFSAGKPLLVDFADLDKYSTKLSDALINRPEDWFECSNGALEKIDFGVDGKRAVMAFNLPKHKILKIKDLICENLNKFVSFEGTIKKVYGVKPRIIYITFVCPACNAKKIVIQDEMFVKKPFMCECGNKRGFTQEMKKYRNTQNLKGQMTYKNNKIGIKKKDIDIELNGDLVNPLFEQNIGKEIYLTGILRDKSSENNKETTLRDLYLEANYIYLSGGDLKK
ncbi:MAG: minichromosome maintenance protein MCM [Candidatus Aenigmarchaeota archaeon]|nr:minichromosome maintenance protein MCM [Candidatus Aenigmarchaeota archaeon]